MMAFTVRSDVRVISPPKANAKEIRRYGGPKSSALSRGSMSHRDQ